MGLIGLPSRSKGNAKTVSVKTANWLDHSAVLVLILAQPGFEIGRDLMVRADRGAVLGLQDLRLPYKRK